MYQGDRNEIANIVRQTEKDTQREKEMDIEKQEGRTQRKICKRKEGEIKGEEKRLENEKKRPSGCMDKTINY